MPSVAAPRASGKKAQQRSGVRKTGSRAQSRSNDATAARHTAAERRSADQGKRAPRKLSSKAAPAPRDRSGSGREAAPAAGMGTAAQPAAAAARVPVEPQRRPASPPSSSLSSSASLHGGGSPSGASASTSEDHDAAREECVPLACDDAAPGSAAVKTAAAGAAEETAAPPRATTPLPPPARESPLQVSFSSPRTVTGVQVELQEIQTRCDYGLCEEEELKRRAYELGVPLCGPWMQAQAAAAAAASSAESMSADAVATRGSSSIPSSPIAVDARKRMSASGSSSNSVRRASWRRTPPASLPHRSIDSLSAATWLRVMGYCDIASLGQLCHVSARLGILSRNDKLWDALYAQQRAVPSADGAAVPDGDDAEAPAHSRGSPSSKEALRAYRQRRGEEANKEVDQLERDLASLQQRMNARVEESHRDHINIARTLAQHNPAAVLTGRFSDALRRNNPQSSRHGGRAANGSPRSHDDDYRRDGHDDGDEEDDDEQGVTSLASMQRQLVQLEVARQAVLASVDAHADMLAEQQRTVEALSRRLAALAIDDDDDNGNDDNNSAGSPLAPAVPAAQSARLDDDDDDDSGGGGNRAAARAPTLHEAVAMAYLRYSDLARFERRVVRLVLNGAYNSNPDVTDALSRAVPLAIRRGLADFAGLQLLLDQWRDAVSCVEAATAAANAVGGEEKEDDRGSSSLSRKRVLESASVHKHIARRWASFQSFFPLTDDYYAVREFLQDQPNSAGVGGGVMNRATPDADGAAAPLTRRMETILLRYTSIVRRVHAMADADILSVVM